ISSRGSFFDILATVRNPARSLHAPSTDGALLEQARSFLSRTSPLNPHPPFFQSLCLPLFPPTNENHLLILMILQNRVSWMSWGRQARPSSTRFGFFPFPLSL